MRPERRRGRGIALMSALVSIHAFNSFTNVLDQLVNAFCALKFAFASSFHVLGGGPSSVALNGDVIVIPNPAQIVQLQMPRQTCRLPLSLESPEGDIHQDTPKAFSHITILYNSRSSNWDSLPANIAHREYPGEYNPLAVLNPI